ncbi:hypothetical protein V6N13_039483 [Hibiscus sabdariffa]
MHAPISTINAPNPTPSISPAYVPGGKPSQHDGDTEANLQRCHSKMVLLVTGDSGGVVLGSKGGEVGAGDGDVAIFGEVSIKLKLLGRAGKGGVNGGGSSGNS